MERTHGQDRRSFLAKSGILALGPLAISLARDAEAAAPTMSDARAASAAGGSYDFDTPYNRIGWDDDKWDGAILREHVDHLIAGMSISDMDFKCAPAITAALKRRVAHENWGETDMSTAGPMAFKRGIIDWNKKHYGIDVITLDNLEITTGVHPGLQAAIRAFTKPGEKVLLAAPIYNGFYSDIRYAKAVPVESPMKYIDGRYEIDWEDFERRITPDVKVSILCNPQNPVGRVWSKEEITRYGEICLKHNVIVLVDEIFCDVLAKGQSFTPFSTLENRAIVDNSITFKSPSKSFSLACMKCAWFFSTNPVLFRAAAEMNSPYLNTLGMIASQAAYAGGEDWMHQAVAYLDANQTFANQYIKANIPMIKVGRKPEGTYLGWIDVTAVADKIGAQKMADEANRNPPIDRRTGVAKRATPEEMVNHWFAHNAFVHMYPGSQYGLGGANHMRINFATSRRTLKAALDSMAGALKKISA